MKLWFKNIFLFIMISCKVFNNPIMAQESSGNSAKTAVTIETGIVYPSLWLGVTHAASSFGFNKGESIDLTLGTVDNKKIKGAGIITYTLAQERYGFGVGAEYAYFRQQNREHFVNYLAAGIGTEPIQAGINLAFDATNWELQQSIHLRAGKEQGLAFAIVASDVTELNNQFTLGIGYNKVNSFIFEVDHPIVTEQWLQHPSVSLLQPNLSISITSFSQSTLNMGINEIHFEKKQGSQSYGKVHFAFCYWWSQWGFILALNKRYGYSLTAMAKL